MREAVFSIVGPVEGARVLDLFAGSGALGLEALSRGAASCLFVERDREAVRVIQANLEKLRLTGAVVANRDVLDVYEPGQHGSTFGGNPVASAIGRKVVEMLGTGELQERSAKLGEYLLQEIRGAELGTVAEVRGRGLWIGIDLAGGAGTARAACETLLGEGVLAKDTHETTIRLAPPLVIEREEIDWALERVLPVLESASD